MRHKNKTSKQQLAQIRDIIQQWLDKQGHDRCWCYPDLFPQIATVLGITPWKAPHLPTRSEFEEGCRKYQNDEYGPV